MDSPPLARVKKLAEEYDANLQAGKNHFRYEVKVIRDDGSVFVTDAAFAMFYVDEDQDEWIIVFAEHYDIAIHAMEDVEGFRVYDPNPTWEVPDLPGSHRPLPKSRGKKGQR